MGKFIAVLFALASCTDAADQMEPPEPDQDGDGFVDREDCAPLDVAIHPNAAEICDGLDNNCDRRVDVDAVDASVWYYDVDNDGYGAEASEPSCKPPHGAIAVAGDCDDRDARIHPNAAEDCAIPKDFNCDGSIGFADVDGDGAAACLDCDDMNAKRSPGLTDVCDTIDNNCDTKVDNGAPNQGALLGTTLFPNIDDALLAATTGQTVQICPGTYSGPPLQVNGKSITITSTTRNAADVVLANQNNHAMFVSGDPSGTTRVENLTFKNAGATAFFGGAIHANDMGLFVKRCRFESNVAYTGAAIYATSSRLYPVKLEVYESVFVGNQTIGGGGAIGVFPGRARSVVAIFDSVFLNNTTKPDPTGPFARGAALVMEGKLDDLLDTVYVVNTRFDNNSAIGDGYGGAIFTWIHGTVDLINSELTNNSAAEGGAVTLYPLYDTARGGTFARFNGTKLDGNIAANRGGALWFPSGMQLNDLIVENSIVTNNHSGASSAAIDARATGMARLSVRSTATAWGGTTAPTDNSPADLMTACGTTLDVVADTTCNGLPSP